MKQVAAIDQSGRSGVWKVKCQASFHSLWVLLPVGTAGDCTDVGLDLRGRNSPPCLGVGTDDWRPVPSSESGLPPLPAELELA